MNFYAETVIVSVLLVGLLTWVVMPLFSRHLFRRFLYRQK
jgi:antibiotic biosynthesis monooxygenase (ABM) superfamily enzyme